MTTRLTITVDGKKHALDVDPDVPLLHVLRRDLGKLGTRFGCGEGQCGSCTVLVDGRVTLACDIPVGAVSGPVETIAGAADMDNRHPVVTALLDGQAGQCGYCLPGITMAAVALLRETPRPSRAQIAKALDANLCRCGAHTRILSAIESAARRMSGDTQ